ncbi:MAG TPA: hypothetical protein VEK34_03825 [Methylocella sp.]|nr:hypothetical protein [Methylocella sp.]
MTMSQGASNPISEADLHAYADGFAGARREAIEAHLKAVPADAARVDLWRRQNELLRAAFGLPQCPALPLLLSSSGEECHRSRVSRGAWMAAALSTGVIITAAADYFANRITTPAPDATAAAVPVLPNLPLEGLKFAGVRALQGESSQKLCLVYAREDAKEVTLCGDTAPGGRETTPLVESGEPTAAISWRQKGANYVLSGHLPGTQLRSVAEVARGEIDAFAER